MEKIVRCIDCGYCDVEPWGAWCNKENAELNDVFDEHKCDSFFQRIKKEASYQQLSKALCGKENATLGEMLEAAEQLKHRAEPEMRPLTLEDLDEMACKDDWEFVWLEYQRVPSFLTQGCPYYVNEVHVWLLTPGTDDEFSYPTNDYNKTWRCWPRKPTPEQMAAAEWEE